MTHPDINRVAALVQHRIEEEGLRGFARRVGLPLGVVRSLAEGRDPSFSNFSAVCASLGLSIRLGGISADQIDHKLALDTQVMGEDFSLIARYDVNVSAGPGLIPVSEAGDGHLAFAKSWLTQHHINPDNAGIVRVQGDSMAPTIPDGALVLVHGAENRLDREGIYAFSRDGHAYIKRLLPIDPTPDGRLAGIVILSDNRAVAPEVVTGRALNGLRIVGRVRSVLTTL